MKTSLFLWMVGAVVALSSCSQSDEESTQPRNDDYVATFLVQAPAATRAKSIKSTRYIVEAYEGKELTATAVRAEAATGSLTLTLRKNTDYTFLFWADKGTINANTGYWNATSLLDVSANDATKAGQVAYCMKADINSKDLTSDFRILLKNATAQVNFIETSGLVTSDNTLKVTYATGTTLNVATGKVSEVAAEVTHTFTGIAQVAKGITFAEDYVLSPLDEQNVINLTVQLNSEPEKKIDNVPFEQNHRTNIKGEYSNLYDSNFVVSNEVEDYEDMPDVDLEKKVKVGYFYYQNDTWSPTYVADLQNPCIGIVFVVNGDGKTGKIVSVDEESDLTWGVQNVDESALGVEGVRATDDGRAATRNMIARYKDAENFQTGYAVFHWMLTTMNGGDINGRWYLPAQDELMALRGSSDEVYPIINTSLASVPGAAQISGTYWSSTEQSHFAVWIHKYPAFGPSYGGKYTQQGRAISIF